MPDLGEEYLRGVQIGVDVKQAKARLQAENQRLAVEQQRTQMEAQARADTLQRQQQMENARIQTEAAYKQAQIGLKKQQLDQVEQLNAIKTRDAAMKVADQQGFASDLAGGMPIEQALFRHPRLSSPAAAIAAHKDALDMAGQRLDLAKQKLDQQKEEFEERQNSKDKPVVIGRTVSKSLNDEGIETGYTEKNIYGKPGKQDRQAVGKYKINTVYKGGLKYLGGDPSDEDSWEKVR